MVHRDADIINPITIYRAKRNTPARVARQVTAAGAIGELSKSNGFTILTNGSFSMIDAIRHVLSVTGPAHVCATTWVVGIQEIFDLYDLKEAGAVLSLRVILDRGFRATRTRIAELAAELLGLENIRETHNHAKIVTIRNDSWDYCLRGSLNLNANSRCENLDGDDSPGLCGMIDSFWYDHAAMFPAGFGQSRADITLAYRELMAEGSTKHGSSPSVSRSEPKSAPIIDPALARFNAILNTK